MTYYLETREWKSLTPQERSEAMREFHFIQENEWRLPPGYLKRMVVATLHCSAKSVYNAMNLHHFNRRILHEAYIHAQRYLTIEADLDHNPISVIGIKP